MALSTPIPQIRVALRARVEWVRKCNGAGDPEPVGDQVARVMRALGG